ncbi:MAG: diguanylate cyclase [Chitinivibrionales bacterium]|nr:diguanylate cyclase [Chitinivibrionales bacterium]
MMMISAENINGSARVPDDEELMFELLEEKPLSVDIVSAFAGDRELNHDEMAEIERKRDEQGIVFFSELLYAVTHQVFRPETAKDLWYRILRHKYEMSTLVRRNIKITVAALDYLSNVSNLVGSATFVSEQQFRDFVRLSSHDGLTGLYNHSYCFQRLDIEMKRYDRYGDTVSLMMIDIDNFKQLNDQYGHPEGDIVLCKLGRFLDAETRECDTCCRYGGEEFVVILPSTDILHAAALARRLRERVEENLSNHPSITISIGVASCGNGITSSDALVKKADVALYKAKREGRNMVVVSS